MFSTIPETQQTDWKHATRTLDCCYTPHVPCYLLMLAGHVLEPRPHRKQSYPSMGSNHEVLDRALHSSLILLCSRDSGAHSIPRLTKQWPARSSSPACLGTVR